MSKQTTKRGVAALLAGAVVASMVTITGASAAECYTFTRNLKKGSTGVDVMNLQKILNMDAATAVAASGAGSAGNETTSFGPATHAAVIKYQEKYASAILTPAGLTKGTGLVYASTRAHLTATCNNSGTGTTTPVVTGPVSVSNGAAVNGTLIVGQAGAVLANFNFSGNGTVNNLELMRTGVSTNSTLKSVYLYDGATRLTDSASVTSDGRITFNAPQGLFSVAGSKTITVRADIDTAATSGQTVGVTVSKMTPMGGSQATVSGVMGSNQLLATITGTTAVSLAQSLAGGDTTVDAGTMGKKVWNVTANVTGRSANFKAITFKYVGSAPVDSLSNVSLYVDAVKVGTGTIMGDKLVFDMTSNPKLLQVGAHTLDLRADVVKGSSRTFEFRVENTADMMFEDTQLTGVSVSANTVNGNVFTISNGKITLNKDPNFTASKVIGGAANAVIGKWEVKAYGEDVKIETAAITFPGSSLTPVPTGGSAIQNVTLYVNGAAVGSSQNLATLGSTLTFNLGSSFIVPAGQTAVFEVRGDMRDGNSIAYTAGTVVATANFTSARGQSSQNTVSPLPSAQPSNSLAISSGTATFAKTGGFLAQTLSPNTQNVKIGSFTIQAGDAEDLRVTGMDIGLVVASGANLTDLSNLKITDGQSTVALPSATSTFNLDVVVTKGTSKTFEVMANVGSVIGGGQVTANAKAYYQGVTTLTNAFSNAPGALLTFNNATIAVGDVTKLSSSPVSQLALGESTNQTIVSYNVKTNGGVGSATVTEMTFTIAPSSDHVTKVTVGGKSATVVGTTATVQGLNLAVPAGNGGVDVLVTVNYGTVATSGGVASQTSAGTSVTLTGVKYSTGSTSNINVGVLSLASNSMQLTASKPVVTVVQSTPESGLILGAENKIGEVTVAADAKGNIKVSQITFQTGNSGFSAAPTITGSRLADGNTTINNVTCTTGATSVCTFSAGNEYTIAAGTSKTFSLFATVTGTAAASATAQVSTKVSGASTDFGWIDVNGNTAILNGQNVYNFPTNSWSKKQ